MTTSTLQTGPMWKNDRGFTFLEIIVVMVIMSLMMALVIPSFNKMFASVEGAREGEKLLRLFEKARAEAILQAESIGITFHKSGLCIFQFRGKVLQYEDLRMAILVEEDEDEELDKIVQTFKPDGTAEYATLTFKTSEGKYIIYNFNPITGKIEMERSSTL